MDKLVSCQIAFLHKAFIALPAFVGFFTPVVALMNLQRILVSQTLMALLAFKRFLTRVDTQVSCQIVFLHKLSITLTATIRLTRVDQ